MVKNVIFDFGGVLLDWNPHYVYDSYFNDAERCDYFLTHICNQAWILEGDAGKPVPLACEELAARYPDWAEPARMFWTRWPDMLGGPIPGMYELVASLKRQGYGLWGLTNWGYETFQLVRDTFPTFRLLDGIVVSSEEKIIKPDPRLYRILLDRYDLKPEECVFIDDNANNVTGARAVGIEAIRFENRDQLAEVLEHEFKIKV